MMTTEIEQTENKGFSVEESQQLINNKFTSIEENIYKALKEWRFNKAKELKTTSSAIIRLDAQLIYIT